jgi:hypothetical protein
MITKIKTYLKSPAFLTLITSLFLTAIVSSVFGLGSYLIWNSFWGGFWVGTATQVIGFAIINTILFRNDAIKTAQLTNEQLQALSKFSLKLACSYCKKPNVIGIKLHEENRFVCEFCKQVNGVKMQFMTTQITTPLEKVSIPVGEETAEIRIS